MQDSLRHLLNYQIISPLSYFFAQFIAQQSGEKIDSLLCQTAALVSECNQQGDVCINLDEYADRMIFEGLNIHSANIDDAGTDTDKPLGIKMPTLEIWINELKASSSVSTAFDLAPLMLDETQLYLGKLWHFEDSLVKQIKQRLNQTSAINEAKLKQGLIRLFGANNNTLDWQKVAAGIVVTQSFSIISGGPGTGKTTTLIKIIALLLEQNPALKIQLCAPTGKAAIRMLEAINSRKNELGLEQNIINKIPNDAKTIHRLLAYRQGQFSFNKESPLTLDCLIIDEASMIDFELMHHLVNALPPHCKLILLGDKDQLSSVDAGHVFSDICGRGTEIHYSQQQAQLLSRLNDITIEHDDSSPQISDAIALLKTSYRFSADSGIGRLAGFVNQGEGRLALKLLKSNTHDLNMTATDNDELTKQSIEYILKHYEPVIKASSIEQSIDAFSKFQVLCAVRKGPLGVNGLNELITQRLFLRKHIPSIEKFNGQPILITQNDYEHNLFNGDIGIMWQHEHQYLVYFHQIDGTLKSYPLISLSHYETAWAITVHKSQGSEYDNVLLVLPNASNSAMIKRELIYTGITRAKSQFSLCCSNDVFLKSCQQQTQRRSGLANKLGWTF